MQQIKIAFFDIDGTLVKLHAGGMTPQTRQALAALRQNPIPALGYFMEHFLDGFDLTLDELN